jgi:hypothetical protein
MHDIIRHEQVHEIAPLGRFDCNTWNCIQSSSYAIGDPAHHRDRDHTHTRKRTSFSSTVVLLLSAKCADCALASIARSGVRCDGRDS